MNILVTHGSERGGTAGIAVRVGEALREAGHAVDVVPARDVPDVRRYDAVVVGGALYAVRWHRDARRLILRHAEALRERPVWLFSSGPLDDSASREDIPPTPHVQQLVDLVGASGHATFGGRLLPDARGFIAHSMARKLAGDFRDDARIDIWARRIARELEAEASGGRLRAARARRPVKDLPSRTLAVVLCLLVGLSAVSGGGALLLRPDGTAIGLPLSVLQRSPFHDFLVPGLLLLGVVGLGNLWAAYLHLVRDDLAALVSFTGGSALVVWTVVEMIMLRSANTLQMSCLLLGAAIVAESIHQVRRMMPPERRPMSGSPPARSAG